MRSLSSSALIFEDDDDGSRTENVDVGSREYPEQFSHIHDTFEEIGQILDGLMREQPALRAFVGQQDGNVDSILERGVEQPGGNANGDHQDSNVKIPPAEDRRATVVLEQDPWQLRALESRFQAVIVYLLQRMNNSYAAVSETLEQGMKGGIIPNPNTP
jgi:hypothetical protein